MTAVIKSFAEKSGSCFAWTETQMLEELLAELKAGKIKPKGMVVVFAEENPDNSARVRSWRAQLGWASEYVYLDVAKNDSLEGSKR